MYEAGPQCYWPSLHACVSQSNKEEPLQGRQNQTIEGCR